LKSDREAGVLQAKHVHFEPWFAAGRPAPGVHWGTLDRDLVFAGLADALRSLSTHVGVETVELSRVSPARLRAPVAKALRG
jgi:hypothetical protein